MSAKNSLACLGLATLLLPTLLSSGEATPAQQRSLTSAQRGMLREPESVAATEGATLHLMVGRSLVITSPARIKRISIADPDIAEAVVVNPNQILLNGRKPGGVSLVLWDEAGQSQTFEVLVDLDILGLSQKIRQAFPREPVTLEASKDVVMLSGSMSSKEVADKIYQLVSAAVPKVISFMEVPPPAAAREILLEVKFAELDQTKLSQWGVNLFAPATQNIGPRQSIGASGTQQFTQPSIQELTIGNAGQVISSKFNIGDLMNLSIFRADIDLAVIIKALQERNVVQILASPNLLTQSGKKASFLAGGEFPFPVVQGGAVGTAPTVTIIFKEFGVKLNFTPTLVNDKRIHLEVAPEVSSLDFTNAIQLSGFLVPSISTRRVQTEMDLEDGQGFAIAGLMDDRLNESAQKIPALGDLPILGHLFRSRTANRTKSELIVLVTPRVVQPQPAGQLPPGPKFPKPFLPPFEEQPAKPGPK